MSASIHVVTGAYGYSGKYITRRLLAERKTVRTITNSLHREDPFDGRVKAFPLSFDQPDKLVDALCGASVLYNTYWVRFNQPEFRHSVAVENTKILFQAAKTAGVERIIHVSITNPSEESPLEYFRGKAILERNLRESGLSYAILRPTVLFGREDILINNIAWILRQFPIFGVFGDGNYRLQPMFVDDLARLAVREGERRQNVVIDAIGPETFTYRELVQVIARCIGKERPIVSIPDWLGYAVGWCLGKVLKDVVITREEIEGLRANLLYTNSPPAGDTRLSDWCREYADTLGIRYASELARRKDRETSYEKISSP
ncbi:MAG: NAD(P)H-binding protein [Planctomycetes bacterium]|nr:NAD(P)H-binding protein [Planctomycetota bacterium]